MIVLVPDHCLFYYEITLRGYNIYFMEMLYCYFTSMVTI